MLGLLKRLLGWDRHAGGTRGPHRNVARPRSSALRTPSRPAERPAGRTDAAPAKHELSLDTEAKDGFDPYNTGVFDRSASWDRISKNSR